MNGAHDVGGMHGFGSIVRDQEGAPFSTSWERLTFGMLVIAMGRGTFTGDECRWAMEDRDPVEYVNLTYYERWLSCLETLATQHGLITKQEYDDRLDAVRAEPGRFQRRGGARDDLGRRMLELIERGGDFTRDVDAEPRFKVGDEARTREENPRGHTRLPRYARDKPCTIVAYHGMHVFPDSNAHGDGESAQPLYTVRFEAKELWGGEHRAEATHLEVWESYLVPAARLCSGVEGGS